MAKKRTGEFKIRIHQVPQALAEVVGPSARARVSSGRFRCNYVIETSRRDAILSHQRGLAKTPAGKVLYGGSATTR
jgi:hypothetical protein